VNGLNRNVTFLFFFSLFFSSSSYGFFSDVTSFMTAYFRAPKAVSSIIPSSSFTSRTITRYVVCEGEPVYILEVGAGTGPFTEELVKKLRPEDSLDVIEIDPDLCLVLEKKFGDFENVQIHCMSMLDWDPEYRYDFLVSAIPHNSFDGIFVQKLLDKYQDLLKNDGVLSYIEFMSMGSIRALFSFGEKKKKWLGMCEKMEQFRNKFYFDKNFVLLNVPPSYIHHLKIIKG